jgi:hypothetical protein
MSHAQRAKGAILGLAFAVALAIPACATETKTTTTTTTNGASTTTTSTSQTYEKNEIDQAVADFFGVTAEAAGAAVERIFSENGRPNAYIKGSEGAGAIGVGLRYGKGKLQMKGGFTEIVYWQGPSVGWDLGANGAKVFTLIYNLPDAEYVYRRFPGVEGSAYFIGGIGINYQRDELVTLAPMRAGVGLRLGANVGYLSYSKHRHILPL